MGAKLAGLQTVGACDVDPKMTKLYEHNLKLQPITDDIRNLQNYNLPEFDILEASPPCTLFSINNTKGKQYLGIKNKFMEGKQKQSLDDLFFVTLDFIKVAKPKYVILENVKGMVHSKHNRLYVDHIFQLFNECNYHMQLFLLNSKHMGIPQSRERIFFIARRKDLYLQDLRLTPNQPIVSINKALKDISINQEDKRYIPKSTKTYQLWEQCEIGKNFATVLKKQSWFSSYRLDYNEPCHTISTNANNFTHPTEARYLSYQELQLLQTFPRDYDFLNKSKIYVLGMSVPPFMYEWIYKQIQEQWII